MTDRTQKSLPIYPGRPGTMTPDAGGDPELCR